MLGLLLWEEGGTLRRLLARGALGTRPVPEAILLSTPNPRYQILSGDWLSHWWKPPSPPKLPNIKGICCPLGQGRGQERDASTYLLPPDKTGHEQPLPARRKKAELTGGFVFLNDIHTTITSGIAMNPTVTTTTSTTVPNNNNGNKQLAWEHFPHALTSYLLCTLQDLQMRNMTFWPQTPGPWPAEMPLHSSMGGFPRAFSRTILLFQVRLFF